MKSPTQFIVRPNKDRRYDNIKKIGSVDFIMSASEEDFKTSNREGIVVETPLRYDGPIKRGDKLLVHHNVFKFFNNIKGLRKSGKSFFSEDKFLIDDEQWYMYNNGEQWFPKDGVCFVRPVKNKFGYKEDLIGEVVYSNRYKKGLKVLFEPECEYEFDVDGETIYRMFDKNIVGCEES